MQLPSSRLSIFAQTLVNDAVKLHQAIVFPQIILRESSPEESRKETKWHIVTFRRKEMKTHVMWTSKISHLVGMLDSEIYLIKVFNFLFILLFLDALIYLYF